MAVLTDALPRSVPKAVASSWFNLWHLVFWILYSADELLSLVGLTEPIIFQNYLVTLGPILLIAYTNLFYLKPRFLDQRRFRSYFLLLAGMVLAFPLIQSQILHQLLGGVDCTECIMPQIGASQEFLSFYIYEVLEVIFILGTTTSIKLFQDLSAARGRIESLENKKLQTELDLLKAQINPHFLFNSLNNIHVLTRTNPHQASETILQLSDLLSYQLYDCSKPQVLLKKEVEYLRNFLELHRIRRIGGEMTFEMQGEPKGIQLPPFLFIPFVENAVKHGNSVTEDGYIRVKMDIQQDKIRFQVANTKGSSASAPSKGGLGLENVKRRLDLLYPDRYRLDIRNEPSTFTIDLEIPLA